MPVSKNPPPGDRGPRLSKSTIIPLLGDRTELVRKGYLIPAGVTAIAVALLFTEFTEGNAYYIAWIFGIYIMLAVNWAFYQFCGRRKPWWVLAGVGVFTCLSLLSIYPFHIVYTFFNIVLLGRIPLLGVGVREEFFKAIPLLILALVYLKWKDPLAKVIGLTEPLDGVLMGVASGSGFTLAETLSPSQHYSGGLIAHGHLAAGLALLLPRMLSELGGHAAYSGYFGYFIGLSVLKPASASNILGDKYTTVKILAIGWFSAALLHGFWDTFANGLVFEIAIFVLSYGCLAAAILKARKISPTRAENFATVVAPAAVASAGMRGASLREAQRPMPHPSPRPSAAPVAAPVRAPALMLRIRGVDFPLKVGTRIEYQALGSAGAGRGPGALGAVEAMPTDASILGLRNISNAAWHAVLPDNRKIEVEKGRVLRLAPGVTIDFGGVEGRVQGAS